MSMVNKSSSVRHVCVSRKKWKICGVCCNLHSFQEIHLFLSALIEFKFIAKNHILIKKSPSCTKKIHSKSCFFLKNLFNACTVSLNFLVWYIHSTTTVISSGGFTNHLYKLWRENHSIYIPQKTIIIHTSSKIVSSS